MLKSRVKSSSSVLLLLLFLAVVHFKSACSVTNLLPAKNIQISKFRGGHTKKVTEDIKDKTEQMPRLIRGGYVYNQSGQSVSGATGVTLATWGVLCVVAVMANAIMRLLPIALQPFINGDFTQQNWIFYVMWTLFMIYVEGYKGFHTKFAPLVVARAFTIEENFSFLNAALAGPYSMGLFFASKKRLVISWSISIGVMLLVMVVKKLRYPWRSIVDSGVVAGLSVGCMSIIYHYVLALLGKLPCIDPCLPLISLANKDNKKND